MGTQAEGAPFGCPLSSGARGFAHPEPIGVTPLLLFNSQMDEHDRSGVIVEDREEDRLLTIDGNAFGVIREHYPKLMPKVMLHAL